MRVRSILPVAALLAAGCAHREVAAPPPPPAPAPVALVPMPAGGRAGMAIPARLPDGGYATPNHALTAAATIWHVRTALNVAALACRDAAEPQRVARYNALLAAQRPAFAAAEKTLAAEYQARGGAAWRDGYDDAMTRLYNYWAQDFARARFCAAADATLDEAQALPAGGLSAAAPRWLGALDAPFVAFFRAYDAWRDQLPATVIAPVAPVPEGAPAQVPWLTVDVAALG
jgi:hypothetical protein